MNIVTFYSADQTGLAAVRADQGSDTVDGRWLTMASGLSALCLRSLPPKDESRIYSLVLSDEQLQTARALDYFRLMPGLLTHNAACAAASLSHHGQTLSYLDPLYGVHHILDQAVVDFRSKQIESASLLFCFKEFNRLSVLLVDVKSETVLQSIALSSQSEKSATAQSIISGFNLVEKKVSDG